MLTHTQTLETFRILGLKLRKKLVRAFGAMGVVLLFQFVCLGPLTLKDMTLDLIRRSMIHLNDNH